MLPLTFIKNQSFWKEPRVVFNNTETSTSRPETQTSATARETTPPRTSPPTSRETSQRRETLGTSAQMSARLRQQIENTRRNQQAAHVNRLTNRVMNRDVVRVAAVRADPEGASPSAPLTVEILSGIKDDKLAKVLYMLYSSQINGWINTTNGKEEKFKRRIANNQPIQTVHFKDFFTEDRCEDDHLPIYIEGSKLMMKQYGWADWTEADIELGSITQTTNVALLNFLALLKDGETTIGDIKVKTNNKAIFGSEANIPTDMQDFIERIEEYMKFSEGSVHAKAIAHIETSTAGEFVDLDENKIRGLFYFAGVQNSGQFKYCKANNIDGKNYIYAIHKTDVNQKIKIDITDKQEFPRSLVAGQNRITELTRTDVEALYQNMNITPLIEKEDKKDLAGKTLNELKANTDLLKRVVDRVRITKSFDFTKKTLTDNSLKTEVETEFRSKLQVNAMISPLNQPRKAEISTILTSAFIEHRFNIFKTAFEANQDNKAVDKNFGFKLRQQNTEYGTTWWHAEAKNMSRFRRAVSEGLSNVLKGLDDTTTSILQFITGARDKRELARKVRNNPVFKVIAGFMGGVAGGTGIRGLVNRLRGRRSNEAITAANLQTLLANSRGIANEVTMQRDFKLSEGATLRIPIGRNNLNGRITVKTNHHPPQTIRLSKANLLDTRQAHFIIPTGYTIPARAVLPRGTRLVGGRRPNAPAARAITQE